MKKHRSLDICAETRQGSRDANEDSYLVLQGATVPPGLLAVIAVADGIGGLGSGHVASSTALTTFGETMRKLAAAFSGNGAPPVLDWLAFSFHKANSAVMRMGMSLEELRGMGTTLTAAVMTEETVYICHMGDSRAYLWQGGELKQITSDDWFRGLRGDDRPAGKQPSGVTLVNQAIGWQPMITPTKVTESLLPGDTLLLCTDGLTDALSDDEITRLMAEGGSVSDICRRLVDTAAETPGSDNTTVVLARLST